MYQRKPLSHSEQIARMRKFTRRMRTEVRHRYDEFFAATRGRYQCPLEVRLRHLRIEMEREVELLAEAALKELERQEAMFFAAFKPGQRVMIDLQLGDRVRREHYLIVDIQPDKQHGCIYVVDRLNKDGSQSKRSMSTWLSQKPGIRLSDLPETEDMRWDSRYYEQCAKTSRLLAFERGDLSLFEPGGELYGSVSSFRRRDRMNPDDPPPARSANTRPTPSAEDGNHYRRFLQSWWRA